MPQACRKSVVSLRILYHKGYQCIFKSCLFGSWRLMFAYLFLLSNYIFSPFLSRYSALHPQPHTDYSLPLLSFMICLSSLISSLITPPLSFFFFFLSSPPDEGQTVCHNPPELAGQRLAEVGMQLRADCHQGLGYWDYLFFIAIGFVIFSAGTVSAWVMGVLMVLYERYSKRKSEELDSDDEDERGGMGGGGGGGGGGGNQGNGDLSKPGMQV